MATGLRGVGGDPYAGVLGSLDGVARTGVLMSGELLGMLARTLLMEGVSFFTLPTLPDFPVAGVPGTSPSSLHKGQFPTSHNCPSNRNLNAHVVDIAALPLRAPGRSGNLPLRRLSLVAPLQLV